MFPDSTLCTLQSCKTLQADCICDMTPAKDDTDHKVEPDREAETDRQAEPAAPKQKPKKKKKERGFCMKKRWIFMTFLFVSTTIFALSFAVYRELNKEKMRKTEILKIYGHMFRHVDEMATTDALISQDRIPVEETVWETNETCTVSCKPKDIFEKAVAVSSESGKNTDFGEPQTGRNQDQQYSFHGCCISYQHHISPDRLPNTADQMRRLVQFKQRKQFFLQDECRHIQNCNRGCKCMRQKIIVAALVVDDDPSLSETPSEEDSLTFSKARLENVVYEGWCKCFNK